MSETAVKPPLIWANTLMFVLTGAIALVAVPWYGLTHGFTRGLVRGHERRVPGIRRRLIAF